MNIMDYLKGRLPTVELIPTNYYQWDIGIHFSLGGEMYQFKNNDDLNLDYFQLVYKQTLTIFIELFEQNDDLFFVTNVYKPKTRVKHRKLKVYQFLKSKKK